MQGQIAQISIEAEGAASPFTKLSITTTHTKTENPEVGVIEEPEAAAPCE